LIELFNFIFQYYPCF